MNRKHLSIAACAALALVSALALGACGSSDEAPANAKKMVFKLTDSGCDPHDAKAPAGPIDFSIENGGTSKVTEMEIMDGEEVLGEQENVTEGLSGGFSLTLEAGEYTIYCPGGDDERGTLTVTGKLKAKGNPEAATAIAEYREYLAQSTEDLSVRIKPFVAAVIAGDVPKAKQLYATTRISYERIEPVAESFGNLDERIDARENEVSPAEFEGFHRIEKALWQEGTARGMAPVARQLRKNIEELTKRVETVELKAVQIANGADELLGEVSASKITGEEERYSHTDLSDFQANVEGAEAAFQAVKPLLSKAEPKRANEIQQGFVTVYAELKPYRRSYGFVPYTALTKADTRKLARAIDTLAEKLSQVPAAIASAERA